MRWDAPQGNKIDCQSESQSGSEIMLGVKGRKQWRRSQSLVCSTPAR